MIVGTQLIKFKQQSDSENNCDYVGEWVERGNKERCITCRQQSPQSQKSQFYGLSGFP